ncbi:putative transposase Ptta/En/Spm plant [Arabidopsis suecica]|uniref:Putative transposase Ptta/En/Spm plant n=1 Tax=Arabidopsis suecica TaxID=45249 RepID=A0A8T2BR34_ARASU|nr:putative transposase Ptta/En/Spm plant [Arabidopsis suecica]
MAPRGGKNKRGRGRAQNSHEEEDEEAEAESEEDVLRESNLLENLLIALQELFLTPGRDQYTTILSPTLEPGTTWFGKDKSKLTRKIAKDTEEAIAKSATTSAARMCNRNGLGPHKHGSGPKQGRPWAKAHEARALGAKNNLYILGAAFRKCDWAGPGPKSYVQVEQEMEVELGRPSTISEVFIRTHTKKDETFVDRKEHEIHEAYNKNKAAKLAALENEESSNGTSRLSQLSQKEDDEIFLQLEEATRKIEEQETLQAEREAEALWVVAKQQGEIKHLTMVKKYLRETDTKFLAFLESQSTDPPTPNVQQP